MNLVIDMWGVFDKEFPTDWKKPEDYNFYVDQYRVYPEKYVIWIHWVNKAGEDKFILFRKPRFQNKILNKLYFIFRHEIVTNDIDRAHNVLTQVVFPDFCKVTSVTADFSEVKTPREAADKTMCLLYKNFFKDYSVDKFIEMFGLTRVLKEESLSYIRRNCILEEE